jgi:hypothetical protein
MFEEDGMTDRDEKVGLSRLADGALYIEYIVTDDEA